MWCGFLAGVLSLLGSLRYMIRSWRRPEELNLVYWLCSTVEATLTVASLFFIAEGGQFLIPFRS